MKIGFTLVLIILTGNVFSQVSNLRLGFQLSPTVTTLRSSDASIESKGANLGIKIGAIGEYYLSENIAVTGGLNLNFHQGGKLIHEIGGNFFPNSTLSDNTLNTGDLPLPNGVKLSYSVQTINMPFSLKYRLKEFGYYRPYIEAPMWCLSYVSQGRGNIEGSGVDVEKENIIRDIALINMSFGFGLGTEYAISESTSLVFGLYYHINVVDFTDDDGYKSFPNPNDTPGTPDDDFFRQEEDSKATLSGFTIRMGMLF